MSDNNDSGGAFSEGSQIITDDESLGGSFSSDESPVVQSLSGEEESQIITDDASLGGSFSSDESPLVQSLSGEVVTATNEAKAAREAALQFKNDAEVSATNAATSETNAATSATNAAASEDSVTLAAANAATSETNAATSASNAATSEANATTSETNAATSEANAANSETNASNSADIAVAKAVAASTSASNAATSEANASLSATASAGSAVQSQTSASNAATSETNAATSESNAATSEANASTSEANAATSEANAFNSETNAANSETNASTYASNAATSASNAFTSESNSATSESNAASSATSANTSATTATTKASEASTSASNAFNSETNASNSATSSATSATASATSEANAATSEANASTSESNAASSETNANASATSASTSATTASTKATEAATSATAAFTSEGNAATSEANASASASNAALSESAASASATSASNSQTAAGTSADSAALSETNAATSETNAATSEANAATSETNASNSATTASTKAAEAATSAANAANSAGDAAVSATQAATSETNAATSEGNAATSEANASTSETNAATSASNASTSEANAATSATSSSTSANTATSKALAAATSESNAATSAVSASDSATAASNSAISAATSATSAANALDSFEDIYLGAKTADPTVDNDGDPLQVGSLYFNSASNDLKIWTGSLWTLVLVDAELQTIVDTSIAALVDSAPNALNTLNELAAALGDDPNYAATTATALSNLQGSISTLDTNKYESGDNIVVGNVTFQDADTGEGTLTWDNTRDTATLTMGNGVVQQIGEELYYPKNTRNMTGNTIPNGTPVMLVGGIGDDSYIAPAISNGTIPHEYYAGLTTEAIVDGAYGRVVFFGSVNEVDTSSFNKGDILYVSDTTPGGFTTDKPESPSHAIQAALVTKVGTTDGRLFVRVHTNPEASEITYDNTTSGLVASNVKGALDELQQNKASVDLLSSNIVLFPTTASSDVTNHNRLVISKSDTDYNTTAVDIATGGIGSTETLVGQLISDAGLVEGSIAGITVTLLGNIEKTAGNSNQGAHFYFKMVRREADGTEHEMGESFHTSTIFETDGYEQFSSSVYLSNSGISTFSLTDRIVLRFYGIAESGSPEYNFQFGGNSPIRSIVPVPISVIPSTAADQTPVDTTSFNGILNNTATNVQAALDIIDDHNHDTAYASLTGYNKTNWDTAYGWGDHEGLYLPIDAVTLPDQTGHTGQFLTTNGTTADWATVDTSDGDTAFSWGDHALAGYLTSLPSHVHTIANVTGLQAALNGKVDDSQVLTNVPSGAVFTDTVYTHPSYSGDDFSVDTGPLTGATVVSDIDINVTTDSLGHVTDANGVVSTRTLTLGDLGYTGAIDANKYVHPTTHPATMITTVDEFTYSDSTNVQDVLDDLDQAIANVNAKDPVLTLNGDVTGTATFTNLGDATLTATVVNDSHTHDTRYVIEGGTSFSGEYPVTVRTGTRTIYSDNNIRFRGSDSRLSVDGSILIASNTAWHAGNDGSGSGLDADLLDGQHGSYYAPASHNHSLTLSGDVSGSGSVSGTISVTVNDDSHNHSNYMPVSRSAAQSSDSFGTYILAKDDGGFLGSTPSGSHNGVGMMTLHTHSGNYYSQLALDTSQNQLWIRSANNTTTFGGWTEIWASNNDGSGSGLDADLLDGQHGSYYASASSIGNGTLTITTSGSASGGGTFSANQSGNTTINITATDTNTTYNFSGSSFTSRDSGNANTIDNSTSNMVGYVNSSSAAGYSDGGAWVAAYSSSWVGQLFVNFRDGALATRGKNNGTWQGWRKVWDNTNDGSGSGLDADLLDGQDGSYYAAASHSHPYLPLSGGTVTGATSLRAGGTHLGNHEFASASGTSTGYADAGIEIREGAYGSTASYSAPRLAFHWGGVVASNISIDTAGAILIRNNPGTGYENLRANNFYANGTNIVWNAGNDGSGSGLDADLLDGLHASSFYRSDNPSGYITASHLNDYTNGAYRVIADYSINTWYINTRSYFTWARSHDWTLTYDLHIGSGTAGANSGWAELGQRQSNSANGTFRGTRFVRHTDGAMVDGDVRAANYYVNGDTYYFKSGSWGFRHQTPSGYIEFGPANTGTAHIYTDRSSFYFNVNTLLANGNTVWTAGNDGSGSGLDADLLDGRHGSSYVDLTSTQSISGAKTFTSGSNHYNGHLYYEAYDANGNHYPHFLDGSGSNGVTVNWRIYNGSSLRLNEWDYTYNKFHTNIQAPIFYDSDNTSYYGNFADSDNSLRVAGNIKSVGNYGRGVVGVYSASRLQHLWSMGEAYLLAANGTTSGNLYGLAWSHPNAGTIGGANHLGGHGMLLLENGVFKGAWGGGRFVTPSDIRGTLFYDYDDTGYYIDPNSASRSFRARGEMLIGPNTSSKYLRIGGNGGASDYSTISTSNGNLHIDATSGYGLYLAWYNTSDVMVGGGIRSTIYYDKDNTSYYWNPNVSGAHRLQTASGYLDIGPMNSTYCHFQTDRGSFYFDKAVRFDGSGAMSYDAYAAASFPVYYDYVDSSYYTDSASESVMAKIKVKENTSNPGYTYMTFKSSTDTQYGSIYRSYGSMVYSTSSDYRLKENVVSLSNASDRLNQLQPKRFNFIEYSDVTVDGFIAHEVAEVVPEAVVGEKDAVDHHGKPIHQSVDHSKLVPLLTASLQEALVKIEDLETRLSLLEQ